jgi:hypothetical protein
MFIYKTDYFGFVYIWFDRKRKRACIGSHMGSLDDGYTSSSLIFKLAYKKRPEDFVRIIIEYAENDDRKKLYEKEQYWLDCIKDEELGKEFYNLKKSATGFDTVTATKHNRARTAAGLNPFSGGKIQSEANKRLVVAGKHNFQSGDLQRAQYKNGTHPIFSGKLIACNQQKIDDGTHRFLDPDWQRSNQYKRVAKGTHPFQGENSVSRRLVKEGTHHFLIKIACPYCAMLGQKNNMNRFHIPNCEMRPPNERETISRNSDIP